MLRRSDDMKNYRIVNDNGIRAVKEVGFEVKEIDGKIAYIFDSPPALMFISTNGTDGAYLYVQGKEVVNAKRVQIDQVVGEPVIYKTESYACVDYGRVPVKK